MPKKSRKQWLVLVGLAVVALAVPPLLLRAEPDNWDRIRGDVAQLSKTERGRLDRNAREYLQMSPEQREYYRRLHAFVEQDAAEGRGRYERALEDYYAWLAQNHLHRDELRAASDPQARIAVMERLIAEQTRDPGRIRNWFVRNRFRSGTPVLSPEQLTLLMSGIEDRAELSPDEKARLENREGMVRYIELLRILADRQQELHQIAGRWDIDALLNQIPDVQLPDGTAGDPAERRRQFLDMLITNLMYQFELARTKVAPSDADLREYVNNWPSDRQAELTMLLELDPDDFRRELEQRYIAEKQGLDMNVLRRAWGAAWIASPGPWERDRSRENARRPRDERRRPRDELRPPFGDDRGEGRLRPRPPFRRGPFRPDAPADPE